MEGARSSESGVGQMWRVPLFISLSMSQVRIIIERMSIIISRNSLATFEASSPAKEARCCID
jgi:hypothetical protein